MNEPFDLAAVRNHEPAATQYFVNEAGAWLKLNNDPRDPRNTTALADFCGFMANATEAGFERDWRRYLELTK